MSFDEEYRGKHDECTFEIDRLNAEIDRLRNVVNYGFCEGLMIGARGDTELLAKANDLWLASNTHPMLTPEIPALDFDTTDTNP